MSAPTALMCRSCASHGWSKFSPNLHPDPLQPCYLRASFSLMSVEVIARWLCRQLGGALGYAYQIFCVSFSKKRHKKWNMSWCDWFYMLWSRGLEQFNIYHHQSVLSPQLRIHLDSAHWNCCFCQIKKKKNLTKQTEDILSCFLRLVSQ